MKLSCLFYSNLVPHFYIVSQKKPRSRNNTEICKKNADGYLKKLAKINHLAVQIRAQAERARGRCGENSWREIVGRVEMVCDVGVWGWGLMHANGVGLSLGFMGIQGMSR